MTLSCKSSWSTHTYGPGIFISQGTVANVEDISGQQLPYMERPFDIGIKLTLEIGRNFQPELVIAGSFKHDPETGEVIGWGSAFVVQEALSRFGYNGILDEANRIPAKALEGIIGKQILRLSYVSGTKDNGKLRYCDWNNIATLEEGAEDLVKRFKRSLSKGYPKNYHPEVLDTPVAEGKAESTEDDPF